MRATISVMIPKGYWHIVKQWLNRVLKAEDDLYLLPPKITVGDKEVTYKTVSGFGKYTICYTQLKDILIIKFEGRRNSFRGGTPYLKFNWVDRFEVNKPVDVILKDINPLAPEVKFLGWVEVYETSEPNKPFYRSWSEG
jgi:hypothetical protein